MPAAKEEIATTPVGPTARLPVPRPYARSAEFYDFLYENRDYRSECAFVDQALRKYGKGRIKDLLDIGCGTGGHSFEFADRGYRVLGLDTSREMIRVGRRKAKGRKDVSFVHGDIRRMRFHRHFDAAISLFAPMSYLATHRDIEQAFLNVRRLLRPGKPFVFDVWNGNAVLKEGPGNTTRTAHVRGDEIVRTASPELDLRRQTCTVNYCFEVRRGPALIDQFEEVHTFRYFFPEEISTYLEQAGFEVRSVGSGQKINVVDSTSWYLTLIARVL
jgi:SAM-dependent methyltransferase